MPKAFFVLICAIFLLTGCSQQALLQRFVPKEDDAFARRFLDLARTGDYPAAEQMLNPSLRGEKAPAGLQQIHRVLAHGEPLAFEVVSCNTTSFTMNGATTRRTDLGYQFHFADGWAVGDVFLQHGNNGETTVIGSHFRPITDSLAVLNRFTLVGKSPAQYLMLAACAATPIFILFVLVVCARSPIRRKWLWIVFILLGIFQVRMDWTSGHVDLQAFSFLLLGASASQASPYAPWILGWAIPLGAIIFLARRRELIEQKQRFDHPGLPPSGPAVGGGGPPPLPQT